MVLIFVLMIMAIILYIGIGCLLAGFAFRNVDDIETKECMTALTILFWPVTITGWWSYILGKLTRDKLNDLIDNIKYKRRSR